MSCKIKHCLIIPWTAAIIESGIIRVIICRIAACPATSVLLPKSGIIRVFASNRNPCSFPVKYTDHTNFVCIGTDVADHGRLALYGCSISVYRTFNTVKTVRKSVSILCCICIGCLGDHHLLAIFIHNIFGNILHILVRSIPERIVGKAKDIIIHIVLFQVCCHRINLVIVCNVGIMKCYQNIFVVICGALTDCLASCCQQFHHRRHIRFIRHSVVDLITNLNHSDINACIKDFLQTILCKIIQSICLLICGHALPCFRCMLSLWICPEIRIVEINADFHAILGCTLTKFYRGCNIIVSAAVTVSIRIVWIIPYTKTDIINTGLSKGLKYVLFLTVISVILCAALLDWQYCGSIHSTDKIIRNSLYRLYEHICRIHGPLCIGNWLCFLNRFCSYALCVSLFAAASPKNRDAHCSTQA